MLILILAESALETVPHGLWGHPSIKRCSRKRGKHPQFILLDRSYHHAAMKTLSQNHKRGRPDIVHFSLLEALGSPLNKEGELQVYVHTTSDYVITVNPRARLPRNYHRFIGLAEQLFELGRIPTTGPFLLKSEHKTLSQLLHDIKPTYVVAFSRAGSPYTLEEVVPKFSRAENPAVVVGGFPHGRFSESTIKLAHEVVCIDPEMLEAWTVISRIICAYEHAISLPKRRLARALRGSRVPDCNALDP